MTERKEAGLPGFRRLGEKVEKVDSRYLGERDGIDSEQQGKSSKM